MVCNVSLTHRVLPRPPLLCSLFYTIVDQVFVPNAQKVLGRIERRTVVIGMTRMLVEVPEFLTTHQASWYAPPADFVVARLLLTWRDTMCHTQG